MLPVSSCYELLSVKRLHNYLLHHLCSSVYMVRPIRRKFVKCERKTIDMRAAFLIVIDVDVYCGGIHYKYYLTWMAGSVNSQRL